MSEQQKEMTRRDFVQTGSTAIAAMTAAGIAPSVGAVGANERINIGVIGCGGISNHHVEMLGAIKDSDNCDIITNFDVYGKRAEDYSDHVNQKFGHPSKVCKSMDEVLENKDVDKVLIATPEHQHFNNANKTLDAGKKNIYLEKPMCQTADQSGALMKRVLDEGAIVQIGVHTASDDVYLAARDAMRDGKLGMILQAQIDYCRHYYTRGPWRSEDKTGDPKPDSLDWQAWLGPAPKVPWDARRYFNWRCYWDYSGGIATDLFIHRITRLIKALELEEPDYGMGYGDIYLWDDGRDIPDNYQMALKYPNKGPMIYVLGTMSNKYGLMHCIRGDKATLVFEEPGFKIYTEDNANEGNKEYGKCIETYERKLTGGDDAFYQGNHINHHAAIRSGSTKDLNCPVTLGHYAVAAVNVANEGYRANKLMKWDQASQTIKPA
ncbi:MAG: Gfo/Idh/MocA family oxidoreductase [Candidatus Omnitrophica bacterium]|nr:Gfo/Idh/MocA family oxidoreductase [Candidatus Omnitrophota bacterium]